jgi:ABC-type transporter Mla MlaB component
LAKPSASRPDAAALVDCDVSALARPDLGAVDALARVALVARRHGCDVRLSHAGSELRELVALAGLDTVLPCASGSGLEPRRQPEHREEPRGVEEEGDPADPVP